MCGLLARFSRKQNYSFPLAKLAGLIEHRGPDASGAVGWNDSSDIRDLAGLESTDMDHVLCHKRLSIIDLHDASDQPFQSEDGRFHLVYNGEIYNYVELRDALQGKGVQFRTSGDTEVLLNCWREWGPACLARLEGMFAFVIYDREKDCIFAARDPFGIKPLLVYRSDDEIIFSSELAPIVEWIKPDRFDPLSAAYSLRWGMNDGDRKTIIPGVERLPPGSFVSLELETLSLSETESYFDLDRIEKRDWQYGEAVEALRTCFLESVERHMRSDAPIGFALSGGIDSSAIVCAAHYLGHRDIKTFSYLPQDERISEKRWIDIVARHVGAETHFIRPATGAVLENLEHVVRHQGEPFASLSIYAQYEVYGEVARQGVKVLLSGQGADELLAGYISYYQLAMANALKRGDVSIFMRYVRHFSARFGISNGAILRNLARSLLPYGIRQSMGKRQFSQMAPWIEADAMQAFGMDAWADLALHDPTSSSITALLVQSIRRSLVALLRYDDRNSMAHSVESRVPFLTPQMAELCLSFPDEFLIDEAGVTKKVFRDAMRGIVPDDVLARADKIGFAPDNRAWAPALRTLPLGSGDTRLEGLIMGEPLESALDHAESKEGTQLAFLWRSINLLALRQNMIGATL
ncbi:asparagine synthase (glutamine-hydrolysing) [Altererythrobacter xiamenensis]|uniref:asparagine synthase (glutamine-hydrolyzing) n=1 Tax=Altererythrobacter xiamenensis TaxID=1316679 RepID=A0A1Y6F2N8_9SPHN|nr:asparagine synthase (glutamine-hydrolyzing) [Altererythrobacter xiamenensis]SMQ69067.1 asparagine synthase (glutamine-hydrolysing) [Altererythrobacter xiamenensis]